MKMEVFTALGKQSAFDGFAAGGDSVPIVSIEHGLRELKSPKREANSLKPAQQAVPGVQSDTG